MKFVIVGTGGTGGVLGGFLAKAGEDVTFIARGEHGQAIKDNGLTIKSIDYGEFTIKPAKVCTMEEYNETPDVMLICTKFNGVPAAVELAKRVAGPETIILPILNVYGTGRIMQEQLPGNLTAMDGCMYVYALKEAPGVIKQMQSILRVFYGFRPGQSRALEAKAKEAEQVMRNAHIEAHLTDDIAQSHLQKFSFVSPMGATGAYFNVTSEDFQKPGEVRDTFAGLIAEVQAIGEAMGVKFKKDLVQYGLKCIDAYGPGGTTSMQRDIAEGRPSEFAGLVDSVVDLGKKLGVPTPYYEKISHWGKEHHIK